MPRRTHRLQDRPCSDHLPQAPSSPAGASQGDDAGEECGRVAGRQRGHEWPCGRREYASISQRPALDTSCCSGAAGPEPGLQAACRSFLQRAPQGRHPVEPIDYGSMARAPCRRSRLCRVERFQAADLRFGPAFGFQESQPGVDIVLGRKPVTVPGRRGVRDRHIRRQLHHRDNRIPA
jgi:hypothetical protein